MTSLRAAVSNLLTQASSGHHVDDHDLATVPENLRGSVASASARLVALHTAGARTDVDRNAAVDQITSEAIAAGIDPHGAVQRRRDDSVRAIVDSIPRGL